MITLLRTNSEQADFIALVRLLDADLAQRDGVSDHAFYSQFNKITAIKHVIVAYNNGIPVGCGAIKEQASDAMEVKRMYVVEDARNSGVASKVLSELEDWAKELGYYRCVLETGKRQPEAIALYSKNGYEITINYGQYIGVENSVCFAKQL